MNRLRIRPYAVDDEKDVIALWVACDLVKPQNNPKRDIQRKLKVNPGWFLVGELNGKIVASCMAGYEGHRGWINYLAVRPDCRGQGHARQIMEEAEKILRMAGCPKINLQVRTTNTKVVEFYQSIGYRLDEAVSMGKRLEPDEPYQAESPDAAGM